MKKSYIFSLAILATMLYTASCSRSTKESEKHSDTPTTGSIKIGVDENFKPILDDALLIYHDIYKDAKITPLYKPEAEAMKDFLEDTTKVIVLSRPLTPDELEGFKKRNYEPTMQIIAKDAIALIVHPDNKDTTVNLPQLRKIMTGKIKSWKELNPASKLGDINIVFDNKNSSSVRYMKDSLVGADKMPDNTFAANNNIEVINYVASHPNSMGIIGVNWISDMRDPKTQSFLKKVQVVGVASSDVTRAYKPYQAYIALGEYPLRRRVYMINRQVHHGLGMGFIAFMAGEKGQRIVLRSGLVPASTPIRVVNLGNNNPLKEGK